jgi:hypothetical protein
MYNTLNYNIQIKLYDRYYEVSVYDLTTSNLILTFTDSQYSSGTDLSYFIRTHNDFNTTIICNNVISIEKEIKSKFITYGYPAKAPGDKIIALDIETQLNNNVITLLSLCIYGGPTISKS